MLFASGGGTSAESEVGRRLEDRTLRNAFFEESARPDTFLAEGGDGEEAERGSLADFEKVLDKTSRA